MAQNLTSDLSQMYEAGGCGIAFIGANIQYAMGLVTGFGVAAILIDIQQDMGRLNGWHRIWLFGTTIWAAFLIGIAAIFGSLESAFTPIATIVGISSGIFLALGYGIAWIRRGFHVNAMPPTPPRPEPDPRFNDRGPFRREG